MSMELPFGASSPMQQVAVDAFNNVQVLILGGAMYGGKTFMAGMLSVPYTFYPDTRIAVFRRTLGEMRQGGGVIDTIKSIYRMVDDGYLDVAGNPPVGKVLKGRGAGSKRGDGCRIEFKQMDSAKDQEKVRGGAYSLAIIEEATPFFTQEEIEMIRSRLRPFGEGGLPSKMIITCNPLKNHFVCDLIRDYYLDENGYAIRERCGDIRYFYKHDNAYYWGNSKQEVLDQVDPLGAFDYSGDLTKEEKFERITSMSFVQLTAKDNPIGMKKDPGYMANLEGMDKVKKARNLYGCWFVEEEVSSFFDRKWLRGENGEKIARLEQVPEGCVAVRAVDKAHNPATEKDPDPDYTALSPLFLKDRNGHYWMLGNYHENMIDKTTIKKTDKPVVGRFRKHAGERDEAIAEQLLMDIANADVYRSYQKPVLALPKDFGAGTGDYASTVALMTEKGIKTVKDPTVGNAKGKKVADFLAFTSACQNGLVHIVESTFDPKTLEAYYRELELFDGSDSTRIRKDDWVDATSLAFNAARTSGRPYRTPARNITMTNTLSTGLY